MGFNNTVTQKEGWFISYLPSIEHTLLAHLNPDPTQDETAIKNEETNEGFYILNGDFVLEYSQLEAWEEAVAFYESKHAEHASMWSAYGL